MTTDAATFVRRPAKASSALAVGAGVLAVGLVADATIQREILGIAVVGLAVFTGGVVAWRRGAPAVGGGIAIVGTIGVLLALGLSVTRPPQFVHRFELLPGVIGLWILVAGVLPVRLGWERSLITAGTGALFVAVLTSGVVRGASLTSLLVAGALTVLAWDAAENAVSVGGQLGTKARTIRGELLHSAGSVVVAGCAILSALVVNRLGIDGLPFAALAALLIASVVLALVHHR